jgi:hypothetical protein
MNKSIRKLVRQYNWHLHEIKSVEVEKYIEMRRWCNKTFAKNTWQGKDYGGNLTWGTKKFAFEKESDKLMFLLKWS